RLRVGTREPHAPLRRALSYAAQFNRLIIQHPEEPSLAGSGHMNGGETATRLGLKGIPRLAEVMMIERDLRLVEMTGARYHAGHISTAQSVEAIRQAKARGLPVSCDTAPHYFALTQFDVGDYRTFAKVSPPLRTDEDREAIIDGIADGTIDAIASDHMPEDQDSKRQPFAQAAIGVIGVETMLPIALELFHKERIDLMALIAAITHRPADLLGLEAGRLSVGAPADFILIDHKRAWKIDAQQLKSKAKNSAFDKRPVLGRVERTVIDGRTVYERATDLRAVA
ncbi:MAG: dihydroorotase, partial [Pseudomonadota bacterium]